MTFKIKESAICVNGRQSELLYLQYSQKLKKKVFLFWEKGNQEVVIFRFSRVRCLLIFINLFIFFN